MSKRKRNRASNDKPARSKPQVSFLAVLALAILLFASVLWAMFALTMFVSVAVVAWDVDNYRPARFTVDEVRYSRSRKGVVQYFAVGRVDGIAPETFNLSAVAPELKTREELESHFNQRPVVIDVMYNPTRTSWRINGDSIRVQPAQPHFAERYRISALYGVANLVAGAIVALLCATTLRRLNRRGKAVKPPVQGRARR